MLVALLLMQAAAQTAVDAERAFYRAAQTEGQWKAFRAFAAPDAVVFMPQPAKAHEALPAKDPPIAVQWWPAESYVSCDGTVAVNTGPWVRAKAVGYFTTVWVKQPDGAWKWVMDGGDGLDKPRPLPKQPKVRRAACSGAVEPFGLVPSGDVKMGSGASKDGTLNWVWTVKSDGARLFQARLWNGREFDIVVENKIAAGAS
jgi:hypothetical protein